MTALGRLRITANILELDAQGNILIIWHVL